MQFAILLFLGLISYLMIMIGGYKSDFDNSKRTSVILMILGITLAIFLIIFTATTYRE
jgi:predicted MFS family arabinose efflux permease